MHGEAIELAGFERVDRGFHLLQWPGRHGRLERQRLPQGVPLGEDSQQGSQGFPGGTGQVFEQGDFGLEKRAGDQLAAQAFVAPVTVATQENVAEQVRLPDVAMEHERVGAGARQRGQGRGQLRLAATRRPFQVGVLLRQQRERQPRGRLVLADQHSSQRRP